MRVLHSYKDLTFYSIYNVLYNSEGEYCIFSGGNSVFLINTSSGKLISTYSPYGKSSLVSAIGVTPDSSKIVLGGDDKNVYLYDVLRNKRHMANYTGHNGKITALVFLSSLSGEGEAAGVLASGSEDRSVRLWDLRASSTYPIQILEEARDSISAISDLCVDTKTIVTASVDGYLRVYDLRRGRLAEFSASGTSMVVDSQSNTHFSKDLPPITWLKRLSLMKGALVVNTLDDHLRLYYQPDSEGASASSHQTSMEYLQDFHKEGVHCNSKLLLRGDVNCNENILLQPSENPSHNVSVFKMTREGTENASFHAYRLEDPPLCIACHPTNPHIFLASSGCGSLIEYSLE